MTTALPLPSPVTDSTQLCSCARPDPHEHATHKGASRSICLNCNLPVRISF